MCGIAGVISRQGKIDRQKLLLAKALLQHRGPDGSGEYVDDTIALLHTRLSIVDLAGGAQPLSTPDKRLHLVANGEIYNAPELKAESEIYSAEAQTQSDCEAILYTYREHGAAGISRLHGMYAFALYDAEKQVLILGRDRLGIKPLYYAVTASGLVFASEIKALIALLGSTPDIHPWAVSQFLNYQFSSGEETAFTGVLRVLPGEYLEIDLHGKVQKQRYWSPADVQTVQYTEDQALEAFEPLFQQVMKEHIRADVPFGLFLSGGIDSSVLLSKLKSLGDNKLSTFSIGFKNTTSTDELTAADELAKQFSSEHHSIRVNRDQLFSRIVRSVWCADDLMRDYASLPTLLLSEIAARDVKVVFSGEGGDEAFAGYRRYKPSLENTLKRIILGAGGIRSRGQWQKQPGSLLLGDSLTRESPRAFYQSLWRQQPQAWSAMQRYQCIDITTALPDNLFVKADRMMMSAGLEGRVPFADHRIIEFGLSLPDALKYNNNRGKAIIRRWIRSELPSDHLNKPKRGFYVPVKEWLSGDFLSQLGAKLSHSEAVRAWFKADKVSALIARQHRRGDVSREVWALMQFAIWHHLFFENLSSIPGSCEDPLEWIA